MSYIEKAATALKMQLAYARMSNPKNPRTGLLYQTWLHAWNCGAGVDSGVDVHSDWTFLLWHRGFLYAHELLLQHFLGGDRTFRLPVWDWESNPDVPWMYHPLPTVKGVNCECPRNESILPVTDACLQGWLQANNFNAFAGNADCPGTVVNYVHSDVHGQISGFMGDPSTAAFDPIFYGHHANIDRYWIHWKEQTGIGDGWDEKTLKDFFYFYDENGNLAGIPISQLLDSKSLGYWYETPKRPIVNTNADTVTAITKDNRVTIADSDWGRILDRVSVLLNAKDLPSISQAIGFLEHLESSMAGRIVGWAAKLPQMSFTCRVEAKPDNVASGRYYSVEMRLAGDDNGVALGGFATFMGKQMAGKAAQTIRPTVSLGLDALALLARSALQGDPPSFQLVYGAALLDSAAKRTGIARIDGPAFPLPVSRFVVQLAVG